MFSDDLSNAETLSVGQSTTVNVTFTPGSTGSYSADFSVTSDAVSVSPFSVVLSGSMGVARVTDSLEVLFDFDNYTSGSSTISSTVGGITMSD